MGKFHFLIGFIKNLYNPKISCFAFVSSNNTIDETVVVYRGAKIKGAKIGAYTYISANTDVENAEIGRFCSIADYCRIGMGGHSLGYLSTSPVFTQITNALQEKWIKKDILGHKSDEERVYIGNDVWIGSHAMVLGGVRVGDGAVIGAGAVVVKDVPPYAVVGGVPARVIRYRFEQRIIDRLVALKWWNSSEEKLKMLVPLFQKDITDDVLCELESSLT